MFNMKVRDLKDGYLKYNHYLFWENKFQYIRGGVTAHSFQDSIFFQSVKCDIHLHDLNYAMAKWRMLVRLYLSPVEFGKMVQRLVHYNNQSKHRGKYVPDIAMQFNSRDNVSGSCLLNLSVGYHNGQWHAVVNSRASETTTRWFADLIFIYVLLKEIGKKIGATPEQMTLRWNMASAYQSITGTPFFLTYEGNENWMIENENNHEDLTPWQEATIKRYFKVFVNKNYSNFRTQKRTMVAYEALKGISEQRNVPTETLDLPGYSIDYILSNLTCEELDMFGGDQDE